MGVKVGYHIIDMLQITKTMLPLVTTVPLYTPQVEDIGSEVLVAKRYRSEISPCREVKEGRTRNSLPSYLFQIQLEEEGKREKEG